ncbi:MAG: hypothetical protein IT162_15065 [Bryobacterales bacterium]|nr:hypothetical protein [Bryobacterales bacterium]
MLQRLSRTEFCNPQHKAAYTDDQNRLAIARLQQLVTEEREAELQGRITQDEGTWPEELQEPVEMPAAVNAPAPAAAVASGSSSGPQRAAAAAPPAPVGVEYEDLAEVSQPPGPPLCGPIYSTELAALGRQGPQTIHSRTEPLGHSHRLPLSPAAAATPRLEPSTRRHFEQLARSVSPAAADKPANANSEPVSKSPMRFPALGIESVDWREALEREKQRLGSIPPMAGLIQIAGPQTLRVQSRLRAPSPQPEHPAGNPVRTYHPTLRGGGASPGMAGTIGGVAAWRTRFGAEGSLRPWWDHNPADVVIAASWMPRFPVFYTTVPWHREGLEEIFGLGPGRGAGPGGDGIAVGDEPPVAPMELPPPGAAAAAGEGEGSGPAGSPVAASAASAQGEGDGTGAGGEAQARDGSGAGAGSSAGAAPGGPAAAQSAGTGGTGADPSTTVAGGRGAGPGSGGHGAGAAHHTAGLATGLPGGGSGGFGQGEGRGNVSVEALAGLVRAARQSTQSRGVLRDLDTGLVDQPARPKPVGEVMWRGMREGSARDLASRGLWWKLTPSPAPELTAPAEASGQAAGAAWEPAPAEAPATQLPVSGARPEDKFTLRGAGREPWRSPWLDGVAGLRQPAPVTAHAADTSLSPAIPAVQPPAAVLGAAARTQPRRPLPEPWVTAQERPATVSGGVPEPFELPGEIRQPARPQSQRPLPGGGGQQLHMGPLKRPTGQWIVMQSGPEVVRFRLTIEPALLGAAAAPGNVPDSLRSASAPPPPPAGLPASRGFVFHEIVLAEGAPELLREPVLCQFGSARGGLWKSQS